MRAELVMTKSKGRIRSLNRRGTRYSKSPAVAQKLAQPSDPTVCGGCGAIYSRKTWRCNRRVTRQFLDRAGWGHCPACRQVRSGEYYGRLILLSAASAPAAIRRRLQNIAARAAYTQPERKLVSVAPAGGDLEVLTTSQKLAHRMARELVKAFGGQVTYRWSDQDGSLLAIWRPRQAAKEVRLLG